MIRRIKLCIPVISLLIATFGVATAHALTYSSDVGVQFTFNSSLQVNVSADLVISNLSPGTDSDSNIIDVVVKTNNATGYTLNATVGNNTTYNTRNLVHNLSGSSANFASINFGSSLASLSTDNTWGYSYSTNNGSTWSNYDGLPLYSDETNIATLKTATGPASTNAGDKVNFKIAAKAATSQYSGEYNNVINFVATANPVPTLGPVACESGKICYNANTINPTDVEGIMGKPNASANSSITLLASNFSREGYGFAGWSDSYDYAYNSNAQLYGPQEDITTPSDMSSGLALYAIWIPSAGSMQTDAAATCSGLTAATNGLKSLSSVSALTDARDDETYAIAKLADGKCWMIENLRLESTAAHNSDGTLAQGYGTSSTYGNFSGLATAESSRFYDTAAANSLYYSGTQSGSATIDIGTNDPGYRMPRYNHFNNQPISTNRPKNPTTNSAVRDTTNAGLYSYGNYYNWAAAIADLTNRGSPSQSPTSTSLCPTGWRLPYGRNTGDGATAGGFSYLDNQLGGTGMNSDSSTIPTGAVISLKWRSYPNNFLYAGSISDSTVFNRGDLGSYWSSTVQGFGSSYLMTLYSSEVRPGTYYNGKYNGYSIRCVISS